MNTETKLEILSHLLTLISKDRLNELKFWLKYPAIQKVGFTQALEFDEDEQDNLIKSHIDFIQFTNSKALLSMANCLGVYFSSEELENCMVHRDYSIEDWIDHLDLDLIQSQLPSYGSVFGETYDFTRPSQEVLAAEIDTVFNKFIEYIDQNRAEI